MSDSQGSSSDEEESENDDETDTNISGNENDSDNEELADVNTDSNAGEPVDDNDSSDDGEKSESDQNAESSEDDDVEEEGELGDGAGNGTKEFCPVCMNYFLGQDLGSPENCSHTFCFECILEWSKNVNTCPIDRIEFNKILVKLTSSGEVLRKVKVKVGAKEPEESLPADNTLCEVCHLGDREDRLLLCDACDLAYHCECLTPSLHSVPIEEWFCPPCSSVLNKNDSSSSSRKSRRIIPRTIASESVRSRIQRLRTGGDLGFTSDEDFKLPSSSSMSKCSNASKTQSPAKAKRKVTRRRKRKTGTRKKTTSTRRKKPGVRKRSTKSSTTVKRGTKRRRRKRRRRKYKRSKTSVRTRKSRFASRALARPSTKTRIADKLGLCKPPKGQSMPYVKKPSSSTGSAEGASCHRIFGDRDQLMDFDEDFTKDVSSKPKCTMDSSAAPTRCKAIEGKISSFDILGSIMLGQNLLHKSSRDITICTDGSLKLANHQLKQEKGGESIRSLKPETSNSQDNLFKVPHSIKTTSSSGRISDNVSFPNSTASNSIKVETKALVKVELHGARSKFETDWRVKTTYPKLEQKKQSMNSNHPNDHTHVSSRHSKEYSKETTRHLAYNERTTGSQSSKTAKQHLLDDHKERKPTMKVRNDSLGGRGHSQNLETHVKSNHGKKERTEPASGSCHDSYKMSVVRDPRFHEDKRSGHRTVSHHSCDAVITKEENNRNNKGLCKQEKLKLAADFSDKIQSKTSTNYNHKEKVQVPRSSSDQRVKDSVNFPENTSVIKKKKITVSNRHSPDQSHRSNTTEHSKGLTNVGHSVCHVKQECDSENCEPSNSLYNHSGSTFTEESKQGNATDTVHNSLVHGHTNTVSTSIKNEKCEVCGKDIVHGLCACCININRTCEAVQENDSFVTPNLVQPAAATGCVTLKPCSPTSLGNPVILVEKDKIPDECTEAVSLAECNQQSISKSNAQTLDNDSTGSASSETSSNVLSQCVKKEKCDICQSEIISGLCPCNKAKICDQKALHVVARSPSHVPADNFSSSTTVDCRTDELNSQTSQVQSSKKRICGICEAEVIFGICHCKEKRYNSKPICTSPKPETGVSSHKLPHLEVEEEKFTKPVKKSSPSSRGSIPAGVKSDSRKLSHSSIQVKADISKSEDVHPDSHRKRTVEANPQAPCVITDSQELSEGKKPDSSSGNIPSSDKRNNDSKLSSDDIPIECVNKEKCRICKNCMSSGKCSCYERTIDDAKQSSTSRVKKLNEHVKSISSGSSEAINKCNKNDLHANLEQHIKKEKCFNCKNEISCCQCSCNVDDKEEQKVLSSASDLSIGLKSERNNPVNAPVETIPCYIKKEKCHNCKVEVSEGICHCNKEIKQKESSSGTFNERKRQKLSNSSADAHCQESVMYNLYATTEVKQAIKKENCHGSQESVIDNLPNSIEVKQSIKKEKCIDNLPNSIEAKQSIGKERCTDCLVEIIDGTCNCNVNTGICPGASGVNQQHEFHERKPAIKDSPKNVSVTIPTSKIVNNVKTKSCPLCKTEVNEGFCECKVKQECRESEHASDQMVQSKEKLRRIHENSGNTSIQKLKHKSLQTKNVDDVFDSHHNPNSIPEEVLYETSVQKVKHRSLVANTVDDELHSHRNPNNVPGLKEKVVHETSGQKAKHKSLQTKTVDGVFNNHHNPNDIPGLKEKVLRETSVQKAKHKSLQTKNADGVFNNNHNPNNIPGLKEQVLCKTSVAKAKDKSHHTNNIDDVLNSCHSPNNVLDLNVKVLLETGIQKVKHESLQIKNVDGVLKNHHNPNMPGLKKDDIKSPHKRKLASDVEILNPEPKKNKFSAVPDAGVHHKSGITHDPSLQDARKKLTKDEHLEKIELEVRTILKPYFKSNQITKDVYKEIMRRCVPKILASSSNIIDKRKIEKLVLEYVAKFIKKLYL